MVNRVTGPSKRLSKCNGTIKQIQELPPKHRIFLEECETFHFTHGDLSDQNILINLDTGEITGVIDWEMTGFRRPSSRCVTGGWFNDDSERFLTSEHQDTRGDYQDETPTDAAISATFRLQLGRKSISLSSLPAGS